MCKDLFKIFGNLIKKLAIHYYLKIFFTLGPQAQKKNRPTEVALRGGFEN